MNTNMIIKNTIGLLIILLFYPGTGASEELNVPRITHIASIGGSGAKGLFKEPVSIAIDRSNGDLVIANSGRFEVLVLDDMGNLRSRIDRADGVISPYGVAVDKSGKIFVSEAFGNSVNIFNPTGSYFSTLKLNSQNGGEVRPGRMLTGPGGELFVVDRQTQSIYVFDEKGNELQIIKAKKQKRQQMLQDIAVDKEGNIYCVNSLGAAVNIFNRQGIYINGFGRHSADKVGFSFPTGISLDSKGRIWIVDSFQHRLKVFNDRGNLLVQFGGVGTESGKFFFPVDMVFGKEGKFYVIEKGANRMQIFQVEDLK